MSIDPSRVLARGTWLYDGKVPCRVFIQREEVWPAFDAPDDNHLEPDRVMPCVSVWFEYAGGNAKGCSGGTYFHTVEEAKDYVAKTLPNAVHWET